MEKSEMMKKFEAETGKQSAIVKFMTGGQALERKSYPKLGPYDYNMEYLAWLEAKATAYDNLVSKTIISDAELDAPLAQRILREMAEKAEAYDRIMSGRKKTLKEWANLLGRPVAMDFGGVVESYNTIPMRCDSAGYWYCDEYSENFEDEHFIIPKECFDYTGSWKDSLTLPDGWEEK